MDTSSVSQWMQIADRYGIPMALFIGLVGLLILGLLALLRWLRPRLDRLVDAVVDLIACLRDEQRRNGESLQAVHMYLGDLRGHVERAGERLGQLDRHGESLVAVRADLTGLRADVVRVGEQLDVIERGIGRGAQRR